MQVGWIGRGSAGASTVGANIDRLFAFGELCHSTGPDAEESSQVGLVKVYDSEPVYFVVVWLLRNRCSNDLGPPAESVSCLGTVIEKKEVNVEDATSRSLEEFVFVEFRWWKKAAVMAKMALGRGGASGFFPTTETGDEIVERNSGIEGFILLLASSKKSSNEGIRCCGRVAIESGLVGW